MHTLKKFSIAAVVAALSAVASGAAQAATITQTNSLSDLVNALTAGNTGLDVTGITISGQDGQFGTYTNASNTYGIGAGIMLSTGAVTNYADGLNTSDSTTTNYGTVETTAQKALLDPITGSLNHYDVAQINVDFNLKSGFDTVFFNAVFGSEEFPEFVNSPFIDGFGLFVNGENIAFSGGQPVNINHPDFQNIAGTELDGVIAPNNNPVLTFSKFLGNGSTGNKLTFIIADSSDGNLDSTAYFSALGGSVPNPKPVPVPSAVPGIILAGVWLSGKLFKHRSKNRKIADSKTIPSVVKSC